MHSFSHRNEKVAIAFGDAAHGIVSVPHVIAAFDGSFIDSVAAATGARPGAWELSPRYDAAERDCYQLERVAFCHWASARNQEWLHRMADTGEGFVSNDILLIDASLNEALLHKDLAPLLHDSMFSSVVWDALSGMLNTVQWVAVPFLPHRELVLFGCKGGTADHSALLKTVLHQEGKWYASLRDEARGVLWDDVEGTHLPSLDFWAS